MGLFENLGSIFFLFFLSLSYFRKKTKDIFLCLSKMPIALPQK